MSKNNYKPAIKAIQEARKTRGMVGDLFLQIIADNPAVIVAAWDKIKPDWCKK